MDTLASPTTGNRDQAAEQGGEGEAGAVVETYFADLRPLAQFTIPASNQDFVYVKMTPGTYRAQAQPASWVYEVATNRRKRMVVVRVES